VNDVLLEAAKQVPNLAVLAVIVWRFLRTIAEQSRRFEAAAVRFAEVAERSAEQIGANTEILRSLSNGGQQQQTVFPYSMR
jgi:hypothetical protein